MKIIFGLGLDICCRAKQPCEDLPQDRVIAGAALPKGRKSFAAAAVVAALGLMAAALTGDAEAQILGTAETFGVLAGTTVTNTGPSVIMGDVGVSPGSAIVGFPPGIVVPPGTIHAGNAVAAQAQVDLTTAYNTLQGMPSQVSLTGQNLGGMVLLPAVYSFATSAQLTGVLTLNGQGNTAAQWVFQIGSTLTTASNSAVLLINGANGNNVYWAVGSSATLGTNTAFAGNIVALTSITLNTGASITCGRALARNGAVTLDNNTITLCASAAVGGGSGVGTDISTNELFGEGVSGAQQTAFGASRLFGSAMMREATFWREGTGQDLTGITPQTNRAMKLGAVHGGPEGIVIEGYQPRTWRLWTSGFGGTASLKGDAATGSADLRTHTAGFAVGLDYQIDRTALIGIAGGYTHSGFSVDQRLTSGTVEGMHVGLYGVKRLGPFYLGATAEYAHFYNQTDRIIDWVLDERAEGKFTSDAFTARLEAGWKRSFGGYSVTPFAGLEVSHLRSQGFTENSERVLGGPGILGLTFASNSVTSLASSLGLQLDTRIALANGQTLTPFARIAWVHEFNPDRSVDAILTLSPAASFSPEGAPAASDLARVNAGLKLDVTRSAALFAYFEGDFSGHGQSYAGHGGIKISW